MRYEKPKKGLCPYCYSGSLEYDELNKQVYCGACRYAVIIKYMEHDEMEMRTIIGGRE